MDTDQLANGKPYPGYRQWTVARGTDANGSVYMQAQSRERHNGDATRVNARMMQAMLKYVGLALRILDGEVISDFNVR